MSWADSQDEKPSRPAGFTARDADVMDSGRQPTNEDEWAEYADAHERYRRAHPSVKPLLPVQPVQHGIGACVYAPSDDEDDEVPALESPGHSDAPAEVGWFGHPEYYAGYNDDMEIVLRGRQPRNNEEWWCLSEAQRRTNEWRDAHPIRK
jgi:hypothetical protein